MVTLIEKPTRGKLQPRRHRRRRRRRPTAKVTAPIGAAGVPEPLRLAQSAQEDRRDPRGAARDQHRADAAERAERSHAMLARVGLRPEHCRPLPAHVLGRPAPAHRHRARADAQPGAAGGRRAGVGARRLGPGAGAEPAGRPAGRARPGLPVHLARPGRGAPHRARRAGDVPRPGDGAGPQGRASSRGRCTPTRRRCWLHAGIARHRRACSASCSRASCLRR